METSQQKTIRILDVLENQDLDKWRVSQIKLYVDALFSFSNIKINNIVHVRERYKVNEEKSPGWASSKHMLEDSSRLAIIRNVDWSADSFIYDIEFLEETWIDSRGIERKTDYKHIYRFKEDDLIFVMEELGGEVIAALSKY